MLEGAIFANSNERNAVKPELDVKTRFLNLWTSGIDWIMQME